MKVFEFEILLLDIGVKGKVCGQNNITISDLMAFEKFVLRSVAGYSQCSVSPFQYWENAILTLLIFLYHYFGSIEIIYESVNLKGVL